MSRRRARARRSPLGTVVVLGIVAAAFVAGYAQWGTADSDAVTTSADAAAGTALAAVGQLDVKGRAAMTGYDRDEFGPAWSDVDHNGCDPRIISSRLVH